MPGQQGRRPARRARTGRPPRHSRGPAPPSPAHRTSTSSPAPPSSAGTAIPNRPEPRHPLVDLGRKALRLVQLARDRPDRLVREAAAPSPRTCACSSLSCNDTSPIRAATLPPFGTRIKHASGGWRAATGFLSGSGPGRWLFLVLEERVGVWAVPALVLLGGGEGGTLGLGELVPEGPRLRLAPALLQLVAPQEGLAVGRRLGGEGFGGVLVRWPCRKWLDGLDLQGLGFVRGGSFGERRRRAPAERPGPARRPAADPRPSPAAGARSCPAPVATSPSASRR